MLMTIATFALGALLAAFAVCAVLLNEGEHAARRRRRVPNPSPPDGTAGETGPLVALDLSSAAPRDGRRLPVGDFLFGALYLQGEDPLPFADLASAAMDSGLDINQTLIWLARAEESGLVERIQQADANAGDQPAVRLTEEGMSRARNNRRSVRSSDRTKS
jgi:hypothetical protein